MKSVHTIGRAATALIALATVWLFAPPTRTGNPTTGRGMRSDRGDVPGWVMITMMTAIVVIVLLGVFQEAVVTAVKNAFDSITGSSGQP